MNNIIKIKDELSNKDQKTLETWSPKQDGIEFNRIIELFKKDGFSEDETLELTKDTASLLGKCINPNSDKKTFFNSTGLVIGQIQSGKTSSMEALAAMAKDNGYKIIIVLSGSIANLANQTKERFGEALNSWGWKRPNLSNDTEINNIITTLKEWDDEDLDLEQKQSILMVSWKNPTRIIKLINIMKEINRQIVSSVPILIIDDECDHHSLTTNRIRRSSSFDQDHARYSGQKLHTPKLDTTLETIADEFSLDIDELIFLNPNINKNKVNKEDTVILEAAETATHRQIKNLRRECKSHTYAGYTGTPGANTLLRTTCNLNPNFAHILSTGINYTGLEYFFSNEESVKKHYIEIPEYELDNLRNDLEKPESLDKALRLFIIGVAQGLANKENIKNKNRSMIIHTSHRTDEVNESHKQYFEFVKGTIQEIKFNINSINKKDFKEIGSDEEINKFKEAYNELSKTYKEILPFEELINKWLKRSIDTLHIIEFNASNKRKIGDLVNWEDAGIYARILIGGMGLDRGYTVKGLTVTYMSRLAQKIQMDTILQRARFFGYHKDYIGFVRIFLTDRLQEKFRNFYEITNNFIESDVGIKNFLQKNIDFKYWRRNFMGKGLSNINITKDNVIGLNLNSLKKPKIILDTKPHRLLESELKNNQTIFEKITTKNEFLYLKDIDEIKNNFIWASENSKHAAAKFRIIENIKLSQVYKEILTELNHHESDNEDFLQLCIFISEFLKNDDVNCPILIMDGRNERSVTEIDTIQPFVGRDTNSNFPGDKVIHYEYLLKNVDNAIPKIIPTLKIYNYKVTDKENNILDNVPIFAFHPSQNIFQESKIYK